MKIVAALILACCAIAAVYGSPQQQYFPLWKVFTQPTPIYRGRADPIVFPGMNSQHCHKVFGGSKFGEFSSTDSPLDVYKTLFASSCTTASITIDKSNYWIPDLYYTWPDGSFQIVPVAGLTVYYEGRTGTGDQSNPKYQAFPPGFRMLAGNPYRRSFNASNVGETGMSYACLSSGPSAETHNFPTDKMFCFNGLRTQVYFPSCWDGKNVDTPDHVSHMTYPTMYNNGNCPASHPVRMAGLFYEVLYSVDKFPHGNGVQPFVWACGDPTGYGLHGDFLNGWDANIFQQALEDPTCLADSTNNGNNVKNCKAFAPYVKDTNDDMACQINTIMNNYEDLGILHKISHLPGCNPADLGPATVTPCMGSWPVVIKSTGVMRLLIKSQKNSMYLSAKTFTTPVAADTQKSDLCYHNMFVSTEVSANTLTIQSEQTLSFLSATTQGNGPIFASRPSADTWEHWAIKFNGTGPTQAGTLGSIFSYASNMYVQTLSTGVLQANSKTPEYFLFIDPNAGVPDTRTKKW